MAVGAGRATSGTVSRTVGADVPQDRQTEEPQGSGGGLREKAGGAGVARAEFGGAVPLQRAQEFAGQILAAAGASHGPSTPRGSSPGHTAVSAVWTRANASAAFLASGPGRQWPAADYSSEPRRKKDAG